MVAFPLGRKPQKRPVAFPQLASRLACRHYVALSSSGRCYGLAGLVASTCPWTTPGNL